MDSLTDLDVLFLDGEPLPEVLQGLSDEPVLLSGSELTDLTTRPAQFN